MIFKPIVESDIKMIKKLQPEGWPDIVEEIKFYIKSPFCNPIKVLCNDEIAGIGTAISYTNTAWLAHIIVSEEHRKKGIGGAIVNSLCSYLKNIGHDTISLIASDLGFPLYKKAGFIERTEYVYLKQAELLDGFSSDNISLITSKEKRDIFSLDMMVSGEDRHKLLNQFLHGGYIYHKREKILGYYLKELGDGLIIANNVEVGKELMKFRASFSKTAVLPIENKIGIDFLKDIGFEQELINRRMTYGKEIKWQPKKVFNRIGGNFG